MDVINIYVDNKLCCTEYLEVVAILRVKRSKREVMEQEKCEISNIHKVVRKWV